MSGLTRDGTAEPVSRSHILRRERGRGKKKDHEQDWQPYLVDTYIHTLLKPMKMNTYYRLIHIIRNSIVGKYINKHVHTFNMVSHLAVCPRIYNHAYARPIPIRMTTEICVEMRKIRYA